MTGTLLSSLRFPLAIAVLLTFSLAAASGKPGSPSWKGKPARSPVPGITVEPGPPLAIDITQTGLQKNSNGGVAFLKFRVSSSIPLEEVALMVKLPPNTGFTDGTGPTKNWAIDMGPSGGQEIPVDLIVWQDGKFVISAEATGKKNDKAVHRGAAFRLLVGVVESLPPVKDGAVEYQGSSFGGGI